MSLIDEINSHKSLTLIDYGEPKLNCFRVVIGEDRVLGEIEDIKIGEVTLSGSRPVGFDDLCRIYEITFDSYVIYSIRNESCCTRDYSEVFTGHLFRVYSKSHFLEYVRTSTFTPEWFPWACGTPAHYEVICNDHIIDVFCVKEPKITISRESRKRFVKDN